MSRSQHVCTSEIMILLKLKAREGYELVLDTHQFGT